MTVRKKLWFCTTLLIFGFSVSSCGNSNASKTKQKKVTAPVNTSNADDATENESNSESQGDDNNQTTNDDNSQSDDNQNQNDSQTIPNNHASLTSDCASCHESDRPKEINNKIHGGGYACESCHQTTENPRWYKTIEFSHLPTPQNCETCHVRPEIAYSRSYPNIGTPSKFNPNDPNALGSGHLVGMDCGQCHKSPAEKSTSFEWDHSGKNPGVCLPCHYAEGKSKHGSLPIGIDLTGFGNCASCHKNFDRNGTRNFDFSAVPGL